MVTVVIVGVLAGIGMATYSGYTRKAKIAEAYQNMDAISKAQITHYLTYKEFRTLIFNIALTGGKAVVPEPVTQATSNASWDYIGNPIPTGTNIHFRYNSVVGKNDSQGNAISRLASASPIQNQLTTSSASQGAWIHGGSATCSNQLSISNYVTPAGKPHYNWAILISTGNFKVESGTDACTWVFRVLETDTQGRISSGNIQTLAYGE